MNIMRRYIISTDPHIPAREYLTRAGARRFTRRLPAGVVWSIGRVALNGRVHQIETGGLNDPSSSAAADDVSSRIAAR